MEAGELRELRGRMGSRVGMRKGAEWALEVGLWRRVEAYGARVSRLYKARQ